MASHTARLRSVLHLILVLALLAPGAGAAVELPAGLSTGSATGMDMPCHDPGVADCCGDECTTPADCARLCAPALNTFATATPVIPAAGWVATPPSRPAPDVTLPLPLRPPVISA